VVRDITADRRLAGQQAQPVGVLLDRIEEAVGTLNDLISEIRDAALADQGG
jgi:hypothetical protein